MKILSFLVIVLFSLFLFVKLASASCVGGLLISEYMEIADVVALGVVKSVNNDYSNFATQKYFKGNGLNDLKVSGQQNESVATSIDLNLKDGGKYLLFLKKPNSADNIYRTNLCSGSREVEGSLSKEELTELKNSSGSEIDKLEPPDVSIEPLIPEDADVTPPSQANFFTNLINFLRGLFSFLKI